MSKVDEVFALISQGLHPTEVAERLGLKVRYVAQIGNFDSVEAYREHRRKDNLRQRQRDREARAALREAEKPLIATRTKRLRNPSA